jgi:hypothetical protein
MDFGYPKDRRASHDSINSSSSGTTTPHKELQSPLSADMPQQQQSERKNPPIVRHVMASSPADFSACKSCCQCGTMLVISSWCIDCKHFECRNC